VPNVVKSTGDIETSQRVIKAPIPNVVKTSTLNTLQKVDISKSSMTSKNASFEFIPNSSKTVIKSLSMNMNNVRKEEKRIR
jgi:hypothetical protein